MSDAPPTVVRASSLTGFADCQRRAAATMFRAEIEAAGFPLRTLPRGIGASIGTAVHKGASVMLAEKAARGELPPPGVVADAAVAEYRAETADGVEFDKETPTQNTAERQVSRMTLSYRTHIAPHVEPLLVEERLEAATGLEGIVLSGQADLVAYQPNGLLDLKTGKQRRYHGPQIGSYSLLARSHSISIDRAGIDFIPRVKITDEQPPPIHEEYDPAQSETEAVNVLRHVAAGLRTWRHGAPEYRIAPHDPAAFLANPGSFLCSARWCAAHSTRFCTAHRNKD